MMRWILLLGLLPRLATAATVTADVQYSAVEISGSDDDTTDEDIATAHAASDPEVFFANIAEATATGSVDGLVALHAELLGSSGDTDITGFARATATWSETFVSESDSKEYAVVMSVPAIELHLYDNCFCGTHPDESPFMRASVDIEVALDGTPVWNASASAEGGYAGHRLVTDGEDLGHVFSGVDTDFTYTVGPHDASIPLGTFPTDQSFTVTATVTVRAQTPYGEHFAEATLGDVEDLIHDNLAVGLAGPRLAVSSRSLDFDQILIGQTATQSLVLSSVGQEDLVVSESALTDAVVFGLDENGGDDPCTTLTPTLAPGESCTFGMSFHPSELGPSEDTLTISSNDVSRPTKEVTLSGYGWSAFGTWMRTYGGPRADYGTGIVQTADGGYLVIGNTDSYGPGGTDIWVLRLRPDGSVVWQKVIGAHSNDTGNAVETTEQGTYIIAGTTTSFSQGGSVEIWLIELDDDGELLWERTYGGGYGGKTVAVTTDGNFLVGSWQPAVTKVSRDGMLWRRTIDGSRLGNVAAMPGGGGVFAVHAYIYGGTSTVGFYELDADGNVVWARSLDHLQGEFCSIHPTEDGGFLVSSNGFIPHGTLIAKLGPDLEVDWHVNLGVPSNFIHPVSLPTPGGGSVNCLACNKMLVKLNDDGAIDWERRADFFPMDVRNTLDGGYAMVGTKTETGHDIVVVKTDPSGLVPDCSIVTPGIAPTTSQVWFTGSREASPILDSPTPDGSSTNHSMNIWDTSAVPNAECTATGAQTDDDGVSDVQEMGTDGVDATYDGNGDGTPDVEQGNVASFHAGNGEYITLATSAGDLENVQNVSNPSPPSAPAGMDFAYDMFSFCITGLAEGAAVTVTLTLHEAAPPDSFYKYGRSPDLLEDHWYEFLYDGTTGAVINGNVISLHLVDGQRGDVDVEANGVIVEPGGPAWEISEPLVPDPTDGSDDDDGGCGCASSGGAAWLALLLLGWRRRR